ncbi:hypothetical protein ACRRTK_003160 [Alexandromys fortis]
MKLQLIAFVLILRTETLAYQSPGPGPEYADVVFLVDSSDDLGSKSFPFVRTFLTKLISSLPIEADKYRVALAQYSDALHNEFQLGTFKNRNPMLNHLKKNFQFIGGSLKIGNALQEAHRTYFSAPTNGRDKKLFPPILVVLASSESEDDVEEASEALREDGVKIISVGVQKASEENLKVMATSQFHFNLRTVRDLSAFAANMTQIIKDVTKYTEGTAVGLITPPAPATPAAPITPVTLTTAATDAAKTVPVPISCQRDSLADIIFLVDESVGTTQNLRDLQSFLENVTSSVDVKDKCMRLGLMSYSDRVQTIASLKSSANQSEFQQQIQKLSLRAGGSNVGAAIEKMRREGFSESGGSRKAQGVPQIAVLVTHRPSDDAVREAALDLRLDGVTMFALGIEGANSTQLEDIVSYPSRQSISTHSSYSHLESYSGNFLKKIHNEIWTQVSTHAEQIELDKTGCVDTKEADIYFLIDGSSSILKKQFEQIQIFMSSVIDMFPIGPDKVRVGVVQYSHKNEEEFPVSLYMDGTALKKAVFNIKQLKGRTFTGKALDFILPIIKKGKSERADDTPCYLIVLTDGKSEDGVLEPANRLRAEHVTIHAVGIGEANKTQLQQIAGNDERVNFGQNFDSLKNIKNEIVYRICSEKGCEDMKSDIMFLVDSSGSIGDANFETMKTFMKNLVGKIQIGANETQVGVVQFSDYNKEEFQLNTFFTHKEIYAAIDRMSPINRNTLTGSALTFVNEYFDLSKGGRPQVRKFLILLTDGQAQDEVGGPAMALRNKSVTIFSVGVYGANRAELEEISGDGSLVFHVENFDHLKAIENKLVFRVCALHDCKRIELLDIVFVLDHSGSINSQQQESMINLTIHLVKKADVGRDRVQFGALRYSNDPEILFYLNTYSSKSDIVEHLRQRRDTGGGTYTAKALQHANILFTEEHGSRLKQNVRQLMIVITDGESHDRDKLNATAWGLRDKGITIFAVGVGDANKDELETMAGKKENTIHVDNFDKLRDIYMPLQETLCNSSQETCNLQEADVIFLCDGSDMVSDSEFVTMTTFLSDLIDNFDIQSQRMKIGMAQYGSRYQEIIELESSLNKTQWKSRVQAVAKSQGFPRIDFALKHVSDMFHPSVGGRRNAGVPQTLVVITSGYPRYDVADAVKALKDLGICVLALDCFVDVVIGFDLSSHLQGQPLFQGHPRLESYLPNILADITSIRGVSCGAGAEAQVSLAFTVNSDQEFPAKFQIYQKSVFDNLLQVTVRGPTHLNAQFLQSLWDVFEEKSASRGQVMLIFSDGLQGESITVLEQQSDRLREAGLDALLVVSLDALAQDEFSSFEFGKGFDYRTHLTIGMTDLGKTLSRYLGSSGLKGSRGHRGEDGDPGVKGFSGAQVWENMEKMGLMDWTEKMDFMDFVGEREKKVTLALRAAQVPEVPLGKMERRASPGIPEWKAGGDSRVPRGKQETWGLKVHWDRKDYKAHRVPLGQQDLEGALEDLDFGGERGSLEFLEAPDQLGPLDSEENRYELSGLGSGARGNGGSMGCSTWEKCPVYPTELVFALDQSSGITERRFNETRDIITSIVSDLNIRENNCPIGARVVVVSYDSDTSYLIRGSDYQSKKHLLQLLSQIKYQVPQKARDIGNAMRFVARNAFKRTSSGSNVRRVAVFFSNGQAASRESILTATMEFSALDISLAVFAYNERVFLDEAFGFDDTGTFQVIPVPPVGNYEPLERLRRCTLCYDKCFPNTCAEETFFPENSYMDVALLLDNSRHIANDDFQAMKTLVSSVIDNFHITSNPSASDRIALLSYSPSENSRKKSKVKTEFEFTAYDNQAIMKNYVHTSIRQLNGDATVGLGLQWAMENLFPGTPNPRKHKVIIVISAGENHEEEEFVRTVSLRAKCQGYVIFVVSLGSTQRDELEQLASYPRDHHLIQLGRMHKPDLNYIVRFLKPFVYSVRRRFNQYPPPMLEGDCLRINIERGDALHGSLRLAANLHEVSASKSSLLGQELSAGKDSFMLEDHGGDRLVYMANQKLKPETLVSHYENDQGSAAMASLTSEHENHGREELGFADEPGDVSLQDYYMDVAFLIDASQRVGNDVFRDVKALTTSVLDYFHIAPDPLTSVLGDRVAVLTYSPPGYLPNTEECPVYLEFDLLTYNRVQQMKHHLQESLKQLNGDVFIGHALQWTIDNVFVGTPNLRKNKVIFIISAGETSPLDKEVLQKASLRAKCQGYSIFVFSFGPVHNDMELEGLASHPLDHHLVQLGRIHKPDMDYIIKFVKPFVHSIRRAINKYPARELQAKCANITFPSPENVGAEDSFFLFPEVYKIETRDSEQFGDSSSQEQHFFVLGDNHGNHSGTTADLIQKLYMLFSSEEVMVNDKEEPHWEETAAPVNNKQGVKLGIQESGSAQVLKGPNYPEWTSMSAYLGACQKTKTCGLYRIPVPLGSAHNQVPKELCFLRHLAQDSVCLQQLGTSLDDSL